MAIVEKFVEKWHEAMYLDADPRSRDKPLMGGPLPLLTICAFYLILIKVIMKKVMDSRKAYETRLMSLALNTYLFLSSCYFFYKSCVIGWFTTYNWWCQPIDRSNSPEAIEVRREVRD